MAARMDRTQVPANPDPVWTTACPDWGERLVQGRSIIPPPLFPEEAAAGLKVFKSLRIHDMAGAPRVGDVSRPWVLDLAGAIFGAYNPVTGRRLITDFVVSVAKKNWKSGLAAGIMLTLLVRNWRPSAEMSILAPTKDIADNAFAPVVEMIRADNELHRLLHVRETERTVVHRTMRSQLAVITGDSAPGSKAGFVLVDELWKFGMIADAADIFREVTGGLASRPEGCVIYLTTQPDKPPAGVFKEKLTFARGVRDGRILAPWLLPVLYEYPEEMLKAEAWRDSRTWYIPNPNLGASVTVEFIQRKKQEAEEGIGEETLAGVLAKHLNVEPGLALKSAHWPGAANWQARADAKLTLDQVLARSESITIGIDAGGSNDWGGLAVLGRERGTRKWLAWTKAWVNVKALKYFKDEAPRWRDFAADGDLVIFDKADADIDEMCEIVLKVQDTGLLVRIGMDPAGTAKIVNEALVFAGVDEKLFVGIGQGFRLMGVIKLVERKLELGALVHGGAPMMAYCAGNARTESRGNAVIVTKEASKGKVDPLMALFDAAECMAVAPAPVDPDAMIAPA